MQTFSELKKGPTCFSIASMKFAKMAILAKTCLGFESAKPRSPVSEAKVCMSCTQTTGARHGRFWCFAEEVGHPTVSLLVVLRPDMQTFALDTGDLGFALSNPRHVWPLLGTVSEVTF